MQLTGEGAPEKRIRDFIMAPIEVVEKSKDRRGCFLCNASADQSALDLQTSEMVRRGFKKLEKALNAPIAQLSLNDDPIKTRKTAQALLTVYSGLRIMVRSGLSTKELRQSTQLILKLTLG